MKHTVIALVASAGLALTPISALLAETAAPSDTATVAKAWVPATQAEQQNARGGGQSGSYSLLNTFCRNVTIRIFFCGKGET